MHQYDAETAVHALVGEGENGKFKAIATATASAFLINDTLYTAVQGGSNTISLAKGQWYLFLLDDEEATVNFSSGGVAGVALNYSIIASVTEPETPAEGTIWLSSSTNVGTVQFGYTTPTTQADGTALEIGDVFIVVGGSSNEIQSADRAINIPIMTVKQYNGTDWVAVTAKRYTNNAWSTVMYCIYYGGVYYVTFSTSLESKFSQYVAYTAALSENYTTKATATIDVTHLSEVYVAVSGLRVSEAASLFARARAYVGTAYGGISGGGSTTASTAGTITVDVSSLTGNQTLQLQIGTYQYQKASTVYCLFGDIWGV